MTDSSGDDMAYSHPEGAPGKLGGAVRLPAGPQRHREVLDHLHEVVFQTDREGRWTYLNAAWSHLSGYTVAESLGRTLFDIIHPDDLADTTARFNSVVNGEADHCYHDLRIITKSGDSRWVWLRSTLLLDEGEYVGNVGTLLDIDERRRREEVMHRESMILERLSADAPLEDVLLNITTLLTDAGANLARVTSNWGDNPPTTASTYAAHGESIDVRSPASGKGSTDQAPGPRAPGPQAPDSDNADHFIAIEITSKLDNEPLGRLEIESEHALPTDMPARAAQIACIALERHRTLEAAQHRTMHDPVTGLPNRSLLEDRLETALAIAARQDHDVAVLLIDINNFRLVNDSFGHFIGDEVLSGLGARLREALRSSDTIGRLGSDEFVVIVPMMTADTEPDALAKLLRQIIARPLKAGGQEFHLEGSIGIAIAHDGGTSSADLLRKADAAMYRARHRHMGQARYDELQDEPRLEGLGLAGELQYATRNDQLLLCYQPIVSIAAHDTVVVQGVECLVRWQHPRRGLLSPDRFIPLAETTGAIWPLTEWVLDEAVACRARLQGAGYQLTTSINLSVRQLDHRLKTMLDSRLGADQRDGIVLELTETGLLSGSQAAARIIDQLQADGYAFAIDDFGTGYASLSYLRALPVQRIKIDRSFVSGMHNEPRDASIVRSAIELAHELDIDVTAEGVESSKTLQMLSDLQCDHAQGYYIGHPMAEGELMNWLRTHH